MKKITLILIPILLMFLAANVNAAPLPQEATDTPTPTVTPTPVMPHYHLSSRVSYGDAAATIMTNLICMVVLIFILLALVLFLRRSQ